MLREYDVFMGDKVIGRAEVQRQGLYYHIRIRCDLDRDIMHKVILRCDNREINMGVLIPLEGRFGIDTQIPVKKAGEGVLHFVVLPRHGEIRGRFVPLCPEEPFQYISRLKDAYLVRREGITGVEIKESCRSEVRHDGIKC